ncbi:arsenic resistance N-acetyltransferase ArsN2 [Sphingomonas sp. A2-49]|uniref:arsenic resistance N-acetyltransferase ArsN2 n=1 Tax=Sphingomonas sp. A2-49 TaxID=1391375 RepID=UPI0021D0265F|nr:arsenic resistance N-acetyltransferase ArsN2 [Sphingomonas sp. A2-49]MCU6453418.1 arsenic resistance N-acetyltransferase ArsN2 [Sphingomonas sp. A2-49]
MAAALLDPGELAGLAWCLDAANLPSADLADPGRLFFRFEADSLVGYGGLEGEGADRLLRSIVILADRRGHGVGRTLVTTLEQQARNRGVERLHLLTTTAASFFRALGYTDADRGAAPRAVAAPREFTALCPASAAYLVKAL